jgi:RNA polymerase-binding transcription factor
MPSKKPTKAAKKPGKATPGKAGHKAAAPKKAARPLLKHTPIATSKVTVKPNKPVPVPKPAAAKPAAVKADRAKPAPVKPAAIKPAAVAPESKSHDAEINDKHAPIKFDTRPLVMPTRPAQNDDDADVDPSVSASLLAGPRNVKPYIARRGEQYMNKEQLDHFARILQNWKRDLMVEVDRTVLHMKDEAANFPDPNDRATQEEEFSLELRTRDRERKLIRKIDEALKRIEDGSYGYCLETGEEIGIKRLEARPVATLSVEAQERRERREKQYGDRDDRYR